MRGEGLVDERFGYRDVARLERIIASEGGRGQTDAGSCVDQVVRRASASTAGLAQEPAEPGVDERRASLVARPTAPRACVENEAVPEMLEEPQTAREQVGVRRQSVTRVI